MTESARLAKLERLALCVAQGCSIRASAKHLGWSDRTAQMYAKMNEFDGRVRAIRDAITDQVVGRLVAKQVRAAERLAKLMDGADTPPAVQLAAARSILQLPTNMKAVRELAEFLKGLEATQDGYRRRLDGPGRAAAAANGQFRGDGPAG
jgi:hypothetical protein